MDITLEIIKPDCRRWLLTLHRDLSDAGHRVAFDILPGREGRRDPVDLALALESRIYRIREHPWQPITPDQLPGRTAHAGAACRISLSDTATDADLRLNLDGEAGVSSLPTRLFSRHLPRVELVRGDGDVAAAGVPGVEFQDVVARGLEQATRRLSTLILMALDARERPLPRPSAAKPAPALNPLAFIAGSLTGKLLRKLAPGRLRRDHWRVGLRRAQAFLPEAQQGVDGFTWLAEDGNRYYADPVFWSEDGRDYLFLEEFPLDTQRGILSYTELSDDGRPRFAPRPIIERTTHLSYPYMFRHAGAIYMMPENAAGGTLPLYRARRFPDLWEELPPLIEGQALHDATLFEHAGRWWILANHACHGEASWDCLVIFHAASPLGPFKPHVLNPVLVDARDARSGGPPIPHLGKLYRPVQNCLAGYGKQIQFHEIEALSTTVFRQRLTGGILPPSRGAIDGAHTYARSDKFEAIDALFARAITKL